MLDYLRYSAVKKDGGVRLMKEGANAIVLVRKFHPNTGAEELPDMGPVNVQDVLKLRENQAKVLAGIDEFLADIKALGVSIEAVKPD
jgi:hypothetical protein